MQDTVGVGKQKFDQEGNGIPAHMATFVLQRPNRKRSHAEALGWKLGGNVA